MGIRNLLFLISELEDSDANEKCSSEDHKQNFHFE